MSREVVIVNATVLIYFNVTFVPTKAEGATFKDVYSRSNASHIKYILRSYTYADE